MSKKKKQSHGAPDSDGHDTSPVLSDQSEPRAQKVVLPTFLIIFSVCLLFLSDIFLMDNSGSYDQRVYGPHHNFADVEGANPPDPVKIEKLKGKRVYDTVCTGCHQANGLGTPGQFPPLAGSDWVNTEGSARIIRLVLSGIQGPITVNGQNYNNAMPPWGPNLKDEEIAAVITYIRNEWGNKGSGVTPEEVAAIRKQVGNREPWNAADLLKVPLK